MRDMDTSISERPTTPHKSQSFTRLASPRSTPSTRSRASTLQNGSIRAPLQADFTASPLEDDKTDRDDIFEKSTLVNGEEGSLKDVTEAESPHDIPDDFDELPIEIISLIDRFVESLSAKVHNTPPSIEKVSALFQDFYAKAETHIATHIQALSTKNARVSSPNPSISSKSSITTRDSAKSIASRKDTSDSTKNNTPEQQMLTPQEISDRRKARRLLDRKAAALEEAVERRVCERAYDRIWRHRTTLDEVRDEKLRSRTAALALVGISLRDLGIVFEPLDSSTSEATLQSDIEDWISKARDGLLRMNESKFPLGKLQQLATAHKVIVDLLTTLHQSSSSADEILPTLIYTLITTPPEGINVISNLHFVQRFRSASKVDGEAAYCLTNLEAAITFLETVDLASLRADEALEGPPKPASRSSTPNDGIKSELKANGAGSASTTSLQSAQVANPSMSQPMTAPDPKRLTKPLSVQPVSHNRRLSDILHEPAHAFGAASDVVRSTADHGIKTIGGTLDNSFKVLFGRLQEQKKASQGVEADKAIVVPKTLDDARKLIEHKSEAEYDEVGATRSPTGDKANEGLLNAIAGRKQNRDRSVDSVQSLESAKKAAPTSDVAERQRTSAANESSFSGTGAVESMRNLGNSLNPLRGFGAMGGLRAFSRTSSSNTATLANTSSGVVSTDKLKTKPQDTASSKEPLDSLPPIKVAPPIPKFLETKSAADLRLGEVSDLLQDYKRLAKALDQMGAL